VDPQNPDVLSEASKSCRATSQQNNLQRVEKRLRVLLGTRLFDLRLSISG
jgi:hypothetical protein